MKSNMGHVIPVVSVIIPTNRQLFLQRTLTALSTQTTTVPFEVLVVENPRKTRRVATLVQHAQQLSNQTFIHTASELGANKARNHGASLARGSILAFTDDDCAPDSRWIERVVTVHALLPTAGVIGGTVQLAYEAEPPPWLVYPLTAMLAETHWKTLHHITTPGPLDITHRHKMHLVSANITCRKSVFDRLGGFYNHIGLIGRKKIIHDELALIEGARKHYAPGLIYDDELVITHFIPRSRTTIKYIRQHAYNSGGEEIRVYHHEQPSTPVSEMYTTAAEYGRSGFTDAFDMKVARAALPNDPLYHQFTRYYLTTCVAKLQGMLDELDSLQKPDQQSSAYRWRRVIERKINQLLLLGKF